MFLSKEFLEEGFPQNNGTRPLLARQPSNGSVVGNAQGQEHGEEPSTPSTAAGLRAKLLQHRQSQLAKQRAGMATGVRVSVVAHEVATPMGARGSKAPALNKAFSEDVSAAAELEDEAKEEECATDNVAPEPAPVLSAEEQARRRQNIVDGLGERGICPEYDPTNGAGCAPPTFQISQVEPCKLKDFLRTPVPPEAGMLQCRLSRDRSGLSNRLHPRYTMESEDGVFLMTAQKQTKNKTANYAISMSRTDLGKSEESFLGKLRSDFLGIEWVAYGPGLNPAKADLSMPQNQQCVREELMAVQFAASRWGSTPKGPQQMSVVMPRVQPSGERIICQPVSPPTEGLIALAKRPEASQFVDQYRNKPPKWHEQKCAFVLNFNSRVTEASVKNFQLINVNDPDKVYLQFGRVGKEAFTLDFQHPISPFQAFSMVLSVFDFKLGCA